MRKQLCALAVVILVGGFLGAQDTGKEQPAEKLVLSEAVKAVLDMPHAARATEQLSPHKAQPSLSRVARAHSANMAKQEKMEHDLDGKNPHERTREAGYRGGFIGENIAAGDQFPAKE